jgi:hypothetical protein
MDRADAIATLRTLQLIERLASQVGLVTEKDEYRRVRDRIPSDVLESIDLKVERSDVLYGIELTRPAGVWGLELSAHVDTRERAKALRDHLMRALDDFMGPMVIGQWSTSPPTETGWYWVEWKRENCPVDDRRQIVYVKVDRGSVWIEDPVLSNGQVEAWFSERIAGPPA